MGLASGARKRQRGEIETLPSGALRVRVYAGNDPLTGKRHYLTQVVPAGPGAARGAEKIRVRFINQVDEQRSPRTKATVNQLLDKWLDVVEIEDSTPSWVRQQDRHAYPPGTRRAPDRTAGRRDAGVVLRRPPEVPRSLRRSAPRQTPGEGQARVRRAV